MTNTGAGLLATFTLWAALLLAQPHTAIAQGAYTQGLPVEPAIALPVELRGQGVQALCQARGGGQWVALERGVAWYDGRRLVPLRGRNGEPFRGVSGIVQTGAGELWLFDADGQTRIAAGELARFMQQPTYDVDYQRFDARRGLAGSEADPAFAASPNFMQTPWFTVLALLALFAALALSYLLHLRRLTRALRHRLEDRMDERERIARALHDTFLQSVQGLILRFQTLLKRLPADGEARALAEKLLDQADQVLVEGRNQVSGLRTMSVAGNDLQQIFSALGASLREQHQDSGAIAFSMAQTGVPEALAEAAAEHLYHLGREALLNAFRHAGARHIELEVAYGADHFLLLVRDDGKGMDETVLRVGHRPGHWGLTGMRERAGKLGATLEWWSRPGLGTEVRLKAPARAVYAGRRRPSALRRLRAWLARDPV